MLTLGLVGCGGMGQRHIKRLHKVQSIGQQQFELVGVCDVRPGNAAARMRPATASTVAAHDNVINQ